MSGDPPSQGEFPRSTAVFDIDSIGLTNVVHGMNLGLDPGQSSIGSPTRFVVGVTANPGALDLDREVNRFMWKVDAGAEFAVTQPVFDVEALFRFLDRTGKWPIPIIAGIWPLRSLREAEYLANEVPGVVVPGVIMERMREAQKVGPEREGQEGINVAREILSSVRQRVRGVHLNTPGGDVDRALAVFEDLSNG